MKFIKLLSAAHVNGSLRHPHEGVLHLEDDEAKRLIEGGLASDVTDDFSSKENKAAPAESITVVGAESTTPDVEPAPHQSEVAPQAVDEPTKTGRKAASSKE